MYSFLPTARPLRHLLFWLGVVGYFGVPQAIYPDYRHTIAHYFFGFAYQQSPYFLAILAAYTLGVGMLYAYAFLGWVLPPLLAGRLGGSLGRFTLLTVAICYLFRLLSALHVAVLDPWLRHRPAHALDPRHFQGLFVNQVYIHEYGTIILLIATYKLLENWQRQQQTAGRLAREQARTDLRLAKARLHPHLLLGSLETLEHLLDEQALQAPDLVLTLSQFLHYVLYDSQAEQVPLAADLATLRHYLTLAEARLGEQVAIAFHVLGPVANQLVAPLLWLPLLENAFQHGLVAAGPAWLNVQLTVTAQQLKLSVSNSAHEAVAAGPAGEGLRALRRQLAARYPGRHTLRLAPEPGLFVAVLTLELTAPTTLSTSSSPVYETALPARG